MTPPIYKKLKAGGPRTVVTMDEAEEIRKRFEDEMAGDGVVVSEVDVSCRCWPVEVLKVLRPVLEKVASTVVVLNIDDMIAKLLTDEGLAVMTMLGEIFRSAPKVESIDLSDNAMGPRALEVIAPALQAPHLTQLHLNNCGLSLETIPQLDDALMVNGMGVARLEALSLDRNMVGVDGAKAVGALLPACKNLKQFSFCGCRPQAEGTKYIAQGVLELAKNNCELVMIKLADCSFGSGEEDDDAIYYLAKAVEKLPSLAHLNINDGDIGEKGMGVLGQALINGGCKMATLDLGACALGPYGAESLAELVKANIGTLKTLKLETNELENDGVEKLLSVFCDDNNVLTELWLDENDLGEDIVSAILACKIPNLNRFSLRENPDLEELEDDKKEAVRKKFPNAKVFIDEEDDEGDGDEQKGDVAVDDLAAAMAGLQT